MSARSGAARRTRTGTGSRASGASTMAIVRPSPAALIDEVSMAAERPLRPAFSRSTAIWTTGRAASMESSMSTTESVVSKIDLI